MPMLRFLCALSFGAALAAAELDCAPPTGNMCVQGTNVLIDHQGDAPPDCIVGPCTKAGAEESCDAPYVIHWQLAGTCKCISKTASVLLGDQGAQQCKAAKAEALMAPHCVADASVRSDFLESNSPQAKSVSRVSKCRTCSSDCDCAPGDTCYDVYKNGDNLPYTAGNKTTPYGLYSYEVEHPATCIATSKIINHDGAQWGTTCSADVTAASLDWSNVNMFCGVVKNVSLSMTCSQARSLDSFILRSTGVSTKLSVPDTCDPTTDAAKQPKYNSFTSTVANTFPRCVSTGKPFVDGTASGAACCEAPYAIAAKPGAGFPDFKCVSDVEVTVNISYAIMTEGSCISGYCHMCEDGVNKCRTIGEGYPPTSDHVGTGRICAAGRFVPFYPADVWSSWDHKAQGPSASILVWTFLCIAFVGMLNACKQRISFLADASPAAAKQSGSGYNSLPNNSQSNPTLASKPPMAQPFAPQPEAANLQPPAAQPEATGYQAASSEFQPSQ